MRRCAACVCVVVVAGVILTGCSAGRRAAEGPARPSIGSAQPSGEPAGSSGGPIAAKPADTFWPPDNPVKMPDKAFGVLTPYRTIITSVNGKPLNFHIKHLSLEAPLPTVPEKLPVYMAGSYPATHSNPLLRDRGWQYVAAYSLVTYLGEPLVPPAGESPATKAAALLKQYRLLEADSQEPTLLAGPGGSTWVAFFRHLDGLPVYGDKPACVQVDANGQVPSLRIRRRPLEQVSLYPTVSPQEAWQQLQRNQFTKPSTDVCQDGGPPLVGEVAEFKVKSVELAYWEPHADEDRMAMMPYYVFRDEAGRTLYVPAVTSAPVPPASGAVRASTLTATLRSSAGYTVHVYLYAADEQTEVVTSPSCMAETGDTLRTGHYTLYTEVEGQWVQRPQDVTPFDSTLFEFNDRRPNSIAVLPGDPDLLLLRQYGSCNGDLLAVLAPTADGTRLVAYRFQSGDGEVASNTATEDIAYPQPGMLQTSFYNNATRKTTTTTWEIRPAEALLVAVQTEVK